MSDKPASEFNTGDIVLLKSSDVPMTVLCHIKGDDALKDGWPEVVKCDFFDGTGFRREKFHPGQLVHAEKHVEFGGNGKIIAEFWRPRDEPFRMDPATIAKLAIETLRKNTDFYECLPNSAPWVV